MRIIYNQNKSKLLSFLLLLMPIFNMYELPGGRGTIADLALVLMFAIAVSRSVLSHNVKLVPSLFLFAIYLVFDGFATMTYTNSPSGQHMTYTIRYLLYFIIFAICFKNYLDINFTIKLYGGFCVLSTIWLLMQYILMVFFHIYLPGFIARFVTREELLTDYLYVNHTIFYRPRSFFEEPAHYAIYVIGFLIILLLTSDTSKKISLKIFLSFGIVLSGSTTGLAMLALAWMVYVYRLFREKKITTKTLSLIFGLLGALYVALQSSTAQILIRRTFQINEASSGRFENVMEALSPKSALEFFFGRGAYVPAISDDVGWLPGWPLIYKCYGAIGLILFFAILFSLFLHGNRNQKIFIALFVLLNIGTEMVTMSFVFPYMAYIVCGMMLDKRIFDGARMEHNLTITNYSLIDEKRG